MIKVEGIVIKETMFGETSKIINVFTKEKGIIGILAKGARTIKSPFRSYTNKLMYGTFNIYYKEDKLSTLSCVDAIDEFKYIKKDLKKISYASFLLDLAEQVYKQSSDVNIYDLLVSSLIKINEGYDEQVIMNILELKYLEYLGVMPILDTCYKCKSKTDILTISADKGGYVCRKCYDNEYIVSDKTIKLIRMYLYVDIDKITKMSVSEKVSNEIDEFLDEYYEKYTGLYLKSKKFLENIKKSQF